MAKTLRELREAQFLTQLQVANQLGVTISTISNWENGKKRPMMRKIPDLARIYKVTPGEISQAIERALTDFGNMNAEEE